MGDANQALLDDARVALSRARRTQRPGRAEPDEFKGFPPELVAELKKQPGFSDIQEATDALTVGVRKYQRQMKSYEKKERQLVHSDSASSFTEMKSHYETTIEYMEASKGDGKTRTIINDYLDARETKGITVMQAMSAYSKDMKGVKKAFIAVETALNNIDIEELNLEAGDKKLVIATQKVTQAKLKEASTAIASIGKLFKVTSYMELLTTGAAALIDQRSAGISTNIAGIETEIQELQNQVQSLKVKNAYNAYETANLSMSQAKDVAAITQGNVRKALIDLDAFFREPERAAPGSDEIGLGDLAERERDFGKAYNETLTALAGCQRTLSKGIWTQLEANMEHIAKRYKMMGLYIPDMAEPMQECMDYHGQIRDLRDGDRRGYDRRLRSFKRWYGEVQALAQQLRDAAD